MQSNNQLTVKEYLNKYKQIVVQDENSLFWSNGKDRMGGHFRKGIKRTL